MKKETSSVSDAGTHNGSRPAGPSVEQLTEQNVETVTKLEEAAREQRKPTDRLAEKVASFCGSMTFVWVHVVWFGGWILFNLVPGITHARGGTADGRAAALELLRLGRQCGRGSQESGITRRESAGAALRCDGTRAHDLFPL